MNRHFLLQLRSKTLPGHITFMAKIWSDYCSVCGLIVADEEEEAGGMFLICHFIGDCGTALYFVVLTKD